MDERERKLAQIHEAIRQCQRCPLGQGRTHAVPGDGPVNAKVMFIGEAPGFYEDQEGQPFVGASGKFLNQLLEKAGIDRKSVYITNVIKCRPPSNRDPHANEIEACHPYLEQQIELINPQVIVTLGRFSMARAFPNAKISEVHGQPRKVGGRVYFPMYHPATALHQPSLRRVVEEDFMHLKEMLDGNLRPREFNPLPDAEQLSLFS